ncbi:hypothetical protein A584_04385 [Pseudomonas syringae pv. theae ICMP 3923]|uniref:hypothetical protein n=1 Tax=Pseudomonas syringae TaxID=317 RepID=UPI0003581E7D|nr:hypothetical protein [Pseudomonas syringae]EPM72601.1 hypothetical protein A584_04385 [Pseudomonas syringae pv. theae ICMP 3923]KPZ33547.1 hypothetical protein AN901_200344 [Pseudomonas syringae pv. theae]MBL3828097.1 hypothetical protein [Pseudomonas syringae pv. theae]MBL3834272.1 hypothetical protein [Pseudomonas syringae pv. theae]MBL3866474.1 hypothetical protein [Pseudomonas syringae pv. theae]
MALILSVAVAWDYSWFALIGSGECALLIGWKLGLGVLARLAMTDNRLAETDSAKEGENRGSMSSNPGMDCRGACSFVTDLKRDKSVQKEEMCQSTF